MYFWWDLKGCLLTVGFPALKGEIKKILEAVHVKDLPVPPQIIEVTATFHLFCVK